MEKSKWHIKKEQEWLTLRHFMQCYKDFPKGKINESESPDFIIQLNRHRKLGIELTRLFLKRDKEDTHFVPMFEGRKNDFMLLLASHFEETQALNLQFHIKFQEDFQPSQSDLLYQVEEVLKLLKEQLEYKDENSFFHFTIDSEILPEFIEEINLVHVPESKTSRWVQCEEHAKGADFLDSIEQAIQHKEEKLSLYSKNRLDNYWLLIAADCFNCATHFNVNNLLEHYLFESNFHRIFLFEVFEQKVYELRT